MVQASCTVCASSEGHMQRIAEAISGYCVDGDCLTLEGDLGAGKTTFARGFIKALCEVDEVVSPTFTLVQTYPTHQKGTIWHFDLYRLESTHEVYETGLEEALDEGISLIEWPKLAEEFLPEHRLRIIINHGDQSSGRVVELSGEQEKWQSCFASLAKMDKMQA